MVTEEKQHDDYGSTQSLLLTLFALFVYDHPTRHALQTRIILAALEDAEIQESTLRITINRMVKRNLLSRERIGRISAFSLTESGEALLSRGRNRIFSAYPFGRHQDQWTLLNYAASLPKSLRYQFETRLQWGGFSALDNRLWIAPGDIDAAELIGHILSDEELASLNIFQAKIVPESKRKKIITTAWDLVHIRQAHERFIATWAPESADHLPSLSAFIRLFNDWVYLLRTDPGLPVTDLDPDWPSIRSEGVFKQLYHPWRSAAEKQFHQIESAILKAG
ncbi:Transcriptional repressor PaaX [Vibrio aerogenes CECT 7868]|uniref:Transcriptional repressor PaaX n=1 Tax=Vibrio aerogenes CECT 7868 TaxID=1216006 RepID=A0A1M5ZE21_9VIBR|nr:PaaX family transcriptional regulator C-terminal domain-containing protein [Vibrio aerogenes]SHI22467.1 Transcriptional repressor PaaX [Vibrio aerogenes CECT 7868]